MNRGLLTIYRNRLLQKSMNIVMNRMPYDTGAMLNQYTKVILTPTGFIIRIEAPYSVYVNEQWLSPQWGGKENPNQGFVQQIVQDIMDTISKVELIDANDSIGKDLPVGDLILDYQKEKYGIGLNEESDVE